MNANERQFKSGSVAGRGGEIVLYKGKDGRTSLDVRLEQDTDWLDAHQMAVLFGRDRTVIVRHIRNIYATNELAKSSTCAKIAQVAADGKLRQMDIYNLDMIISVGYRVNSKQGTQFRIWATQVLCDHILQGYTINEKRMQSEVARLSELKNAVDVMGRILAEKSVFDDEAQGLLKVIADYSLALRLLYFVVKNHAFVDGNKRIAAFLFIWYLNANGILYRADGGKRLADNALVALTLLIAESKPAEKDILCKVIVNLINRENL